MDEDDISSIATLAFSSSDGGASDIVTEPTVSLSADSTTMAEERASNPSNFGDYFPSERQLLVRLDDVYTGDGYLNLRVDTEIIEAGRPIHLKLFHVKICDLESREFSIRRYEGSSGREVCHTTRGRKDWRSPRDLLPGYTNDHKQPSFHRVLEDSRAYSSAHRRRASSVASASSSRASSLRSVPEESDIQDQISTHEEDSDEFVAKLRGETLSTEKIKLEFGDYARVNMSRKKRNISRYNFEYWGDHYRWRRKVSFKNGIGQVHFHLRRKGNRKTIAHIVQMRGPQYQGKDAEWAGHWIPPCLMQIADETVINNLSDIADVLVCIGLVALIDSCIPTRSSTRRKRALPTFPGPNVDYLGKYSDRQEVC